VSVSGAFDLVEDRDGHRARSHVGGSVGRDKQLVTPEYITRGAARCECLRRRYRDPVHVVYARQESQLLELVPRRRDSGLGTRRTAQVLDQQVVIIACGQTPRSMAQCSVGIPESCRELGPDVFLCDRAVDPLGDSDHAASSFELSDDTGPLP
jgi:hypothetical protein